MEINFDSLSGMSLQTYRAYVPESVGPLNPGRRPREGMPSPELFIGDPYRKKIVEVVNGVLRLPYFETLEKWYSRNQQELAATVKSNLKETFKSARFDVACGEYINCKDWDVPFLVVKVKCSSERWQWLPRGLELLITVKGPTSSLGDPFLVGRVSISGFISSSTVDRVEEQVDRLLSSHAPMDALVIVIDSVDGEMPFAEGVCAELEKGMLKELRKIVFVIGDVTHAGYRIALVGTEIFCRRFSKMGFIRAQIEDEDQDGIPAKRRRGGNKSPSKEAEKNLFKGLDRTFWDDVTRYRPGVGKHEKDVKGGPIFWGEKALELGLVDGVFTNTWKEKVAEILGSTAIDYLPTTSS